MECSREEVSFFDIEFGQNIVSRMFFGLLSELQYLMFFVLSLIYSKKPIYKNQSFLLKIGQNTKDTNSH
jgi:hypothetical protein